MAEDDGAALSRDEQALLVAHEVALWRALEPRGLSRVETDQIALRTFASVLAAYRDARIAGLCHEGACEVAEAVSHQAMQRSHL